MRKVLFIATVVKKHIMEFHIPYLKMFKEKGWETYVAARNDYDSPDECNIPFCDHYIDVSFERFPFKLKNLNAYRTLKKVIDGNKFDIIHCHTPVGATIGRLASIKARLDGTRVIYTAHGFHFYKGAPFKNWVAYFPAELICSFVTDTLITINQEDYAFAKKNLYAKETKYVHGVGIDLQRFRISGINAKAIREELKIPQDCIWLLTVGELIPRKNHERLLEAIVDIPNVYLSIAGSGKLKDKLEKKTKELGIANRVKMLGYRSDIPDLCEASDIFIFPSLQEGLPVAIMEAMACGKAIICSDIRGNKDLVESDGGVLFNPYDIEDIKQAVIKMMQMNYVEMGRNNVNKIMKYELGSVMHEMQGIYGV